jgi:hypothetical protein
LPWTDHGEVDASALPADPAPPELDLTLAYVGFALLTTLTYWLAPPRRTTTNKESPGTAVPGLS